MKKLMFIVVVLLVFSVPGYAQMGGGMMSGQGQMMEQEKSQQPQAESIGAKIFSAECAGCHPNGGNIIVPSLPLRGSRILTNFKTFVAFIRSPKMPDGSQGSMPSFPTSKISNQQAKELYHFVTLSEGFSTKGGDGPMGGYGMGPGMMGGYGMGHGMMEGGMGYGPEMEGMQGIGMMGHNTFGALDLTTEQRTKINKIQDEMRKQHWAIMGQMMEEQSILRDLYEEEKLDGKKISTVSDAIYALRKKMIETRIDAINRMREILTKEQREQLNKLLRRGCGMMGSGYGHGSMMNR